MKVNAVVLRLTAVPVPDKETVWVLPAALLLLSVTVSVPVRVPDAAGLNVTVIVQLAPAARGETQVLVWAKSPVAAMLLMVSGEVPVLESVTVWPALVVLANCIGKISDAGDTPATGAIPVPVRGTESEAAGDALFTSSDAERAPAAEGVNVTLIVQLDPAARPKPPIGQSTFVWVKSPAFVPVTPMLFMINASVPVFDNVAV